MSNIVIGSGKNRGGTYNTDKGTLSNKTNNANSKNNTTQNPNVIYDNKGNPIGSKAPDNLSSKNTNPLNPAFGGIVKDTTHRTYKLFDGSEESYREIADNQPETKEFKTPIQKMKRGHYYPVLNSQEYTLGVIIDEKERTKTFYTPEEHWKEIIRLHETQKKKGQKLYIYAHNHRYDFFGYAKNHIFEFYNKKAGSMIIKENTLYAIWENTTYFLDTMSFYPKKLSLIGEELGIPKKEMPTTITTPQELEEYCVQDTLITLKAVMNLKKNLTLIGYKPRKLMTAGQLAISTFLTETRRKKTHWQFMKDGQIYRSQNTEKVRLAYRGARCQAFKKGTYEGTVLDINRMYAYAMTKIEFPNLKEQITLDKPTMNDWQYITQLTGVIECTIQANTKKLPYLMAYTKLKEKPKPVTLYPSKARIRGTWTIDEINYALKIGGYELVAIHWAECYKKIKNNPIKEYVEKIYKMGQEKPELDKTSKMLLNNLYGKFAQINTTEEKKIIWREELNNLDKEWQFEGYIDDKAIISKKGKPYIAPYTNPLISALITSKARQYHYEQLNKIPQEDLLYCDTDSIVYKGQHDDKFNINPKELGALKIEYKGKLTIRGRKNWQPLDKQAKIAGIPKRDLPKKPMQEHKTSIRRMIGITEAITQGNTKDIGRFKTINFNLDGEDIDSIKIPELIDEREAYDARTKNLN